MELTLLFVLLPGLLSYGVGQSLRGFKHLPISDIIVSLSLQSTVVFVVYTFMISIVPTWKGLNIIHFAAVFVDIKNQTAPIAKDLIVTEGDNLAQALMIIFIIAIFVGFFIAVANEKRWLRSIGKCFHLFQSNETDHPWKDLVETASASCWAQIRTKDGRHLTGCVAAISNDYKNGLGLKNIYLQNSETQSFEFCAKYVFMSADDIDGAIFFTEPFKPQNSSEVNNDKSKNK